MRGSIRRSDTPTTWAYGRAGFVRGPRKLNAVGTRSSRRTGAACAAPGWKTGANMNAIPASARHRSTPSGPRSIRTPRASSRSADPQCDEAARLPCLATTTPAPAATIAASVEMLNVSERSPQVPHGLGHLEGGARQALDLVDGLALRAKGHQESADLGWCGAPFHDRQHGAGGLLRREGLPAGQPHEKGRPETGVLRGNLVLHWSRNANRSSRAGSPRPRTNRAPEASIHWPIETGDRPVRRQAGVVQWQNVSFPSSRRGFDSPRPLHPGKPGCTSLRQHLPPSCRGSWARWDTGRRADTPRTLAGLACRSPCPSGSGRRASRLGSLAA